MLRSLSRIATGCSGRGRSASTGSGSPMKRPGGRPLRLEGSLALDPDFVHRARARFSGEVVQITTIADTMRSPFGETQTRPLSAGDHVEKDDLLAVIWSKDLGEKKSELLDALSQLRLDQVTLERLKRFAISVPERTLEEAQRRVDADLIAVERAKRTLRVWRVTEAEM